MEIALQTRDQAGFKSNKASFHLTIRKQYGFILDQIQVL